MAPEKPTAAEVPAPLPWLGRFHRVRVVLVAMVLAMVLVHVGYCGSLTAYHVVLLLFGLGYPHAVEMVSGRFERRRGQGRATLLLDGFFAGVLIPAIDFDVVPSVVLAAISVFNWMAVGGAGFSAVGAIALLSGVGLSLVFLDLPSAVGSCGPSSLVAYGVLLTYLPFVAWVVFRYSAALRHHCDSLQNERDAAEAGNRKAAQALLAVLPASAARVLAQMGRLPEQANPEATLLLIDVLPPAHGTLGIGGLGEIFAACDEILGRHGLEGVKTMGRRYVALGAGAADPDKALRAALEIVAYFADHDTAEGRQALRVVVHGGSVAAGLVQPARFNYDLAGPAVEEATALAQRGFEVPILVSASIRKRLKDDWRLIALPGEDAAFALADSGAG